MGTKFVFSGTGTRGDLLPMLAMAAELQRRGHACHLLSNEPAAGPAQQLGVPFTAIAPAQTNNLVSVEENFGNIVFASYQPTFDFIERELARGTHVVLVNPENYAASTLMAERHGLPLFRYTLAPYRISSLEAPYYPLSEAVQGWLGKLVRRYLLAGLLERRYNHPYILERMNAFRTQLGLPALSSWRVLDRLVTHQICLFPEWYCPPASDWPQALDCVGFPLTPARGQLPEHVAQFIRQHGAPLVFTPGTGVADVKQFFTAAASCCQLLGKPGIFLSPCLDAGALPPGQALLHLPYLELEQLLPHAALLVHHGGIGTTARALEAGIPQIISPQAFDQPDNGHRITLLGAGAVVERRRLSGEALAKQAQTLLGSLETRRTLAELSRQIRETDAIGAAATLLERHSRAARTARTAA
jgi:rhamnosyltransferase subunit B